MPTPQAAWARSVALVAMTAIVCFLAISFIRSGQDTIRQEIITRDNERRATEQVAAEREAHTNALTAERENRALLLLEVLKQTQAIEIAGRLQSRELELRDARIGELYARLRSLASPPLTQPTPTTQPTQPTQ